MFVIKRSDALGLVSKSQENINTEKRCRCLCLSPPHCAAGTELQAALLGAASHSCGLGVESPTASGPVKTLPQSSTSPVPKRHEVGSAQFRLPAFLPPAQIPDHTSFPASSDLFVFGLSPICVYLTKSWWILFDLVVSAICSLRRHQPH